MRKAYGIAKLTHAHNKKGFIKTVITVRVKCLRYKNQMFVSVCVCVECDGHITVGRCGGQLERIG